jgi:ubiquilin
MLQEMLRNPEMRRMMFSPEMMRMQLQMQRSMNRNGGGSSFPAPGATDNTPQANATTPSGGANATQNQPSNTGAADPFAAFGGGAGAQANPFASLFAPGANPFAQPQQPSTNTTGTDSNNNPSTPNQQNQPAGAANPFGNLFGAQGGQANPIAEAARNLMQNPEAMRSMMQMMGGGGAGAGAGAGLGAGAGANPFAAFGQPPAGGDAGSAQQNPFAALFGPGGGFGGFTPPPADNRPPEEVYEVQLRQLNEMGFYEFDRNVSALRRSGGNVQGAIEYLLNGGA